MGKFTRLENGKLKSYNESGGGGYSVAASQTTGFTAAVSTLYPCDASGSVFTATLPTAVGNGNLQIKILKTDASTNAVTLNTTSSQTIGDRASGDVKCRQLGDYVEVVSDGSNWIILDKKETQYINSSGAESLANIGSAGNFGLLATSAALTYGIWEIEGQFLLNVGNGTAPAIISGSGFFAADGANSASTPSSLSGVISGTTTWNDFSSAVSLQSVGSNSRITSSLNKIVLSITSSQTVYLVPQIDYSTTGTSQVYTVLRAKRIW
jgi:hypothetical protein